MTFEPETHMKDNRSVHLFDTIESHENLLPLSFTRPIADFRIGITTIREKWQRAMPGEYHYLPVDYLREKFGQLPSGSDCKLFVSGALLPNPDIIAAIESLDDGEALTSPVSDNLLAMRGTAANFLQNDFKPVHYNGELKSIRFPYDIFLLNNETISSDFKELTKGRSSLPIHPSNTIIGDSVDSNGNPRIFLEEGARMTGATVNLTNGPVYIGKNAEIMEGACIRGPLAICREGKIKMGAKIYEGCTFGPFCKVGGEIDNSVFFGYSNKAHDGYLGNAVVGEWCNIGAGVNASNLKNDYSKIRLWNYHTHTFMRTDLQFCGPIIGDHTKIGVNCMLNTATVLGVGVNIHGAGFPRVFVPSFSEGSSATGFTNVSISKFIQIAERVLARRGKTITEADREIYELVYEVASSFKN